jgi:hypothetical protein
MALIGVGTEIEVIKVQHILVMPDDTGHQFEVTDQHGNVWAVTLLSEP